MHPPPHFSVQSPPHLLWVSQAQGQGAQLGGLGNLLRGLESLLPWGRELTHLWGPGAALRQGDAQGLGPLQQLVLVLLSGLVLALPLGLVLVLPLGLVPALPLGLREPGLRLEVRFCQSLLQSLGGVLGSLLWDLCSGLGSRLQT